MPGHAHTPDCGCGDSDDDREFFVRVVVKGGQASVSTDLAQASEPTRANLLAALALHLQVPTALDVLAKGTDGEGKANVDARYPVLEHLIRNARRDWATYGDQLVDKVLEIMRGQTELTPKLRDQLQELFRAHEAAVLLRFAGVGDQAARRAAVNGGFIPRGATIWSDTDVAFRAGVGMDLLMQAVQNEDPEVAEAQVRDVVEAFGKQPMTDSEVVALDYARSRAARFMRRPIQDQHYAILDILIPQGTPTVGDRGGPAKPVAPGEAGARPEAAERPAAAEDRGTWRGTPGDRSLTDREYAAVRPAIERAVLERRTAAQLARDLREAVAGTELTNDMERVARTELRSAHAEGAYQRLKTQTETAGIKDPQVYKLTSPTGCKQCIRIWGRGGSKRYLLSQVEAWEAEGGNYGRPAASWGPTIGPVHPNCFPAGTLITVQGTPDGVPIEAIQIGDVVLTHRGRWRPVTATMSRDAIELHRITTFGGRVLEGTAEHPVMTPEGWVELQHLRAGSRITVADTNGTLMTNGATSTAVVREKAHRLSGVVRVFNFSVADDESYVANGVVVHNCTCGPLLLYVGETQHRAVLNAVDEIVNQIRAERAQGV